MTSPIAPAPPQKPEDYECCHRGCDPCIFDYYWAARERWIGRMRALGLPIAEDAAE